MSEQKKKRSSKDYLVILIMLVCGIYLINPGFGFFELIPDHLPIIGNLDEGVATTLILSGLSYFGYDFTNFFKRSS